MRTSNIFIFSSISRSPPQCHHMSLWTSWSSLLGMAEDRFLRLGRQLARLRCPDDVSDDIGGCIARSVLKPKFYQPTQTMVTAGILPFRENSHGTCFGDQYLTASTVTAAVAQWLRCRTINLKVAGSIPAGVSGFFIGIKSFQLHCPWGQLSL